MVCPQATGAERPAWTRKSSTTSAIAACLILTDPKAKMIYDVAKSLHEGHGVARPLYDAAVELLTLRGVTEIIGLCGYYTMVSMNTFEFRTAGGRSVGFGVRLVLPRPVLTGRGSG